MHISIYAAAAALGLTALAQPASAADQPPASWARCAICHSAVANKPSPLGPNLSGVVGKPAGGRAGYAYSAAMKASGITWTPEKLDAFLTKPQAVVPGTKMMFAGLSDAKLRAEIIRYLQGTR